MSRKDPKEITDRVRQALADELAVEELVSSIGDIPDELLTPFNRACRKGDYDAFHKLEGPTEKDTRQGPALYFAIQGGDWRIIQRFLGDDPDERFPDYRTPLMVAAEVGSLPALETLLSYECRLDLVDRNGESAVHKAARAGHVGVLDLLLHHGADPYLVDPRGRTLSPLALAIEGGHSRCITRLLLHDPDLLRHANVDRVKLEELKKHDDELWSVLAFEEGLGPIMSDHFHVEDLHTIQSPRCPFCGKWAWGRQTYEENQEEGVDWQQCEHQLASALFMFGFQEPGPLSEGSGFEQAFFGDSGKAANALRTAVKRLVQFADAQGLDADDLIQKAFGTRPLWWDDQEYKVNESMDWLESALENDVAVCSFMHEDVRFVSLATVHVYYAEDHEAVRRRFCERVSGEAERLEGWLDGRGAPEARCPAEDAG